MSKSVEDEEIKKTSGGIKCIVQLSNSICLYFHPEWYFESQLQCVIVFRLLYEDLTNYAQVNIQ